MTITRPLGIGVIGVGRHGSRYIRHLLHDLPDTTLVAVCRKRMGETLREISRHSIPVYGDYRTLIADPMVQAVVVVTPPTLCHDICLEAVRAGKPLLIEKPLAPTAREALAMVREAERAGVLLMTAHTMRFDPTIMMVKDMLPKIGRLCSAAMTSHVEFKSSTSDTTRAYGHRGALLEIGIHLLDLVRFLTCDEVREVSCEMTPGPSDCPETKAAVHLTTLQGINCRLDVARVATGRVGRMEWIGTKGQVSADWTQRRVTTTRAEGPSEEMTMEARPTIVSILQAFIHAIQTNERPPVTGADGQKAVEIAEACYRSAELGGRPVWVETCS